MENEEKKGKLAAHTRSEIQGLADEGKFYLQCFEEWSEEEGDDCVICGKPTEYIALAEGHPRAHPALGFVHICSSEEASQAYAPAGVWSSCLKILRRTHD